jgi:oligoribonuclease (3'-5' exoribonuclease)
MSFILIIDCEFTGPNMVKNAMINLGAVFMKVEEKKTLKKIELMINIPQGKEWDKETRKWFESNHTTINLLKVIDENRGMDIKSAMNDFYSFIIECTKMSDQQLTIAGDHIDIDAGWINYYLAQADIKPLHLITGKLSHLVDISSYHKGIANVTHQNVLEFEQYANKKFHHQESVMQYLQITERSPKIYTHIASDDAENIGENHCIVLNHLAFKNEHERQYYPSTSYKQQQYYYSPYMTHSIIPSIPFISPSVFGSEETLQKMYSGGYPPLNKVLLNSNITKRKFPSPHNNQKKTFSSENDNNNIITPEKNNQNVSSFSSSSNSLKFET